MFTATYSQLISHRRINSYLWVCYMLINLSNNQAKRRYLFQNRQRRFPTRAPLCNYLVSELRSSKPLTTIYNRLNFDLGTIGNHEFNYGLPYLIDTLQNLNHPVLCANILDSKQQPLQVKAYIILKRRTNNRRHRFDYTKYP